MRKSHILLLVFVTIAISVLISFMGTLTTYDTVETAKKTPGKFIHLIARIDHSEPVIYDAIKDPNYLSFTAIDSLGDVVKVIYRNAKPDNLEASDRLVLKGAMKDNYFECKEILMKCPSKYKDEIKKVANIQEEESVKEPELNNAGTNKPL